MSESIHPDAGSSRTRALLLGIITSIPSRALALIAPLILIPFALSSIGAARFGLWATAASVSAVAVFADLGIGNGLLTKLTNAYATGDIALSRRLTSSAYAFTSLLAVGLSIFFIAVLVVLDGSQWVIDTGIPPTEAMGIIGVCGFAFIIGIPVSLVTRVQYASGHVPMANLWQAIASLASAGAFVFARLGGLGVVVSVALSAFALPLAAMINSVVFYLHTEPRLNFLRSHASVRLAGQLARMGGLFFVIGVATAIGLNLDLTLVAARLTLVDSGQYSVALRITGVLSSFFLLVSLPLWPANGAALAAGDIDWVRKTTRRMMWIAALVVSVPGVLIAVVLREPILSWLGNTEVAPTRALLLGLVVWNVCIAASSPLFMVQNAAGVLWPQVIGWLAFGFVSITAKWFLLRDLGLIAVPIVSVLSFVVLVAPQAWYGYHISLRQKSINNSLPSGAFSEYPQ